MVLHILFSKKSFPTLFWHWLLGIMDSRKVPKKSLVFLVERIETLDEQIRQSPIASVQRTRSTLASHSIFRSTWSECCIQRTPIAEFEPRHNERRVCEGLIFCVFEGDMTASRTLAIRIAAITLGSDSAITIARFRPSKIETLRFFRDLFPTFWGQASYHWRRNYYIFYFREKILSTLFDTDVWGIMGLGIWRLLYMGIGNRNASP